MKDNICAVNSAVLTCIMSFTVWIQGRLPFEEMTVLNLSLVDILLSSTAFIISVHLERFIVDWTITETFNKNCSHYYDKQAADLCTLSLYFVHRAGRRVFFTFRLTLPLSCDVAPGVQEESWMSCKKRRITLSVSERLNLADMRAMIWVKRRECKTSMKVLPLVETLKLTKKK